MNQQTQELIEKFGRTGNPPPGYKKLDNISAGWAWWCNRESIFGPNLDYGLYHKQ